MAIRTVVTRTRRVTKYSTTRRKKRGSSKSLRRIEDIENRASRLLRRVSKAVDRGVETYRIKRKKSNRKYRDGAVVDSYENAAVGIAEAVSDSSFAHCPWLPAHARTGARDHSFEQGRPPLIRDDHPRTDRACTVRSTSWHLNGIEVPDTESQQLVTMEDQIKRRVVIPSQPRCVHSASANAGTHTPRPNVLSDAVRRPVVLTANTCGYGSLPSH